MAKQGTEYNDEIITLLRSQAVADSHFSISAFSEEGYAGGYVSISEEGEESTYTVVFQANDCALARGTLGAVRRMCTYTDKFSEATPLEKRRRRPLTIAH